MLYSKPYAVHHFEITKTCTYHTESVAIRYEENLKKLSKDEFTTVKIPKFSFKRNYNVIICKMEFIKGVQLNQDTKELYSKQIYEDIVLRKNSPNREYSFIDYSAHNFIVCENTNDLYFVDLECYQKMPVDYRKDLFFHKYKFIYWKSYKS